jgi:hypothetical protein
MQVDRLANAAGIHRSHDMESAAAGSLQRMPFEAVHALEVIGIHDTDETSR